MELFSLQNKLALVTGGAKGIGRFIAEGLAEAGANLIIVDLDQANGKTTAADIKGHYHVEAQLIETDVTSEEQVASLRQQISKKYGRLDILVNNAGILGPGGSPESLSLQNWERMIRADMTSVFLCCRELGSIMIQQNQGKIINISSIYGVVGSDLIDVISYNTAKAGVINFTRDLALKWARHNIGVNSIAPGYFMTPATQESIGALGKKLDEYIPMKRIGDADDIKGVAVFLASRASDYITGQTIIVDGGWTIR